MCIINPQPVKEEVVKGLFKVVAKDPLTGDLYSPMKGPAKPLLKGVWLEAEGDPGAFYAFETKTEAEQFIAFLKKTYNNQQYRALFSRAVLSKALREYWDNHSMEVLDCLIVIPVSLKGKIEKGIAAAPQECELSLTALQGRELKLEEV